MALYCPRPGGHISDYEGWLDGSDYAEKSVGGLELLVKHNLRFAAVIEMAGQDDMLSYSIW